MKIYNIRLKIKKKVIHEDFIRTNLTIEEIESAFKPPYADILVVEIKDDIRTVEVAEVESVEPKIKSSAVLIYIVLIFKPVALFLHWYALLLLIAPV